MGVRGIRDNEAHEYDVMSHNILYIFEGPGVAGAVLQTPLSLID